MSEGRNTLSRYKFLRLIPDDSGDEHHIVSDWDWSEWEIGKERRVEGKIELCCNGFHCSTNIGVANWYVKGDVLAEVEVSGENKIGDDKEAWECMTIKRAWLWTYEDKIAWDDLENAGGWNEEEEHAWFLARLENKTPMEVAH